MVLIYFSVVPRARRDLQSAAADTRKLLASMPAQLESAEDRRILVCSKAASVVGRFEALSGSSACADERAPELRLGVRCRKLYDAFARDLEKAAPDFMSDDFHAAVLEKTEETRAGLSIFLSEQLFRRLFLDAMAEPLRSLSETLVVESRCVVQDVLERLLRAAVPAHPGLRREMEDEMRAVLTEAEEKLGTIVKSQVESQACSFFAQGSQTLRLLSELF